jgi:hypothetical protein
LSFDIAPFKTKTPDFEWRLSLKTGDLIDCSDIPGVWYNSTILNSRVTVEKDGVEVPEVYVGYRVYKEDGDKHDPLNNKRFGGWSAKYDEWLSVTHPRIQK